MKLSKAQMSIFLLLMVFIIIIFVFLLSLTFDEEEKRINQGEEVLTTDSQVYSTLQEELDFCLLKSLRKATVIGGYLGGYIYADHPDTGDFEFYSPSVYLSEYYDENFLSDLEISQSYLRSNTLYYYTTIPHIPLFNSSFEYSLDGEQQIIFSRSIESDFEKYVEDEVQNCLDFEKYELQGFNLSFYDYTGEYVEYTSPDKAQFKKMDARVGDNVSMFLGSRTYDGEVIQIEDDILEVEFDQALFPLSSGVEPSGITNQDLGIFVDVSFFEEEISAEIDFPVTILNKNVEQAFSSISSSATLDNRFSRLKSLMDRLIYEKQMNKSLDYFLEEDVASSLNKNTYFRSLTNPEDITVIKTPIKSENDYKQFVYSIVDSSYKIQGKPFVFNAAYKNDAPYLDLSTPSLGCSNIEESSYDMYTSETDVCYIYVAEQSEQTYSVDLLAAVVDKQRADNNQIYFEPKSEDSASSYFKLDSDGTMEYRGSGVKTYEVIVGDRETQREYLFSFVVGLPNNENNEDTQTCVVLNNRIQENANYPIIPMYENKLFMGEDASGGILPFGYVLDHFQSRAKVSLNPSCFQNGENLDAEIAITNAAGEEVFSSTSLSLTEKVEIPRGSPYYVVEYNVLGNQDNRLLNEPFKLVVYSSGCLGPGVSRLGYGDDIEFQSCCDTDLLSEHTQRIQHPVSLQDSLMKTGETIFDDTLYFGYVLDGLGYPSHSSIWEKNSVLQEKISSIFQGNMKVTCGGEYPRWIDNIDGITSTQNDYNGEVDTIHLDTLTYEQEDVFFQLRLVEEGQICSRPEIEDVIFEFNVKNSDIILKAGFSGELKGILEDAPPGYSGPDKFVCEENYYGSSESSPDWIDAAIGPLNEDISKSYKFCDGGSTMSCGSFYPDETVDGSLCKETSFDGEELSTTILPDGTTCGEGRVVESYNETHNEVTQYTCQNEQCVSEIIYEED